MDIGLGQHLHRITFRSYHWGSMRLIISNFTKKIIPAKMGVKEEIYYGKK
jgi:hypothetical protein